MVRYQRPPGHRSWPGLHAVPLAVSHMRRRFEAILAWYSLPTGYAAARAKRILGCPVVVSPRGGVLCPGRWEKADERTRAVVRAGYRGADRIVSISHYLADRVRAVCGEGEGGDAGLPPIDVVYNGLDWRALERERLATRASPPPVAAKVGDRPFVLHLARVDPIKNQTLAVRAVAAAKSAFEASGTLYVIAGVGGDLEKVRMLVTELGVGHIVQMTGEQVGSDKAWLLDRAVCMVTSSLDEGLGGVQIEAVCSGLPVLASDLPAHREVTGDLGVGRLFESDHLAAMAEGLRAMVRGDLGGYRERCLAVRERFSLDAMAAGYERGMLAAIGGKHPDTG